MKSVGASSKNPERKSIIARMPNWMRPSGAFGIGLQSAFLISSEVQFETKSLLTGSSLKITMASPLSKQRGLIYIERDIMQPGRDSGTTLSLEIDTAAIPTNISLSSEHDFTASVLADFDPICMVDIPFEAARIVDETANFSMLSPLSIHLAYNGQVLLAGQEEEENINRTRYFNPTTGVMLIGPRFDSRFSHTYRNNISFRGQNISKYRPEIPFVLFEADILTESAPITLTINRNDLKDTARRHVYQLLIETIAEYLKRNASQLLPLLSIEEKAAASAYLAWHGEEDACPDLQDYWKNMKMVETGLSIAELCQKNEFRLYLDRTSNQGHIKPQPNEVGVIREYEIRGPRYQLLLQNWKKLNGYLQALPGDMKDDTRLLFSKKIMPPFENSKLKQVLLTFNNNQFSFGGRYSIPTWDEYNKLSAHTGRLPWCRTISDCHIYYDHFVLPFFFGRHQNKIKKVTTDGLDELCDWTVKHSIYPDTTKNQVRALYDKFINWIDSEIMADSPEWKAMRRFE